MRLGLFGGTFNPIHLGHLILAECAREQLRLDQVWFIPTATPPHKSSRGLLDGRTRLALIRLAVRGHPAFQARDLELRLSGVSYTLRTVRWIAQRYPNAKLFFLMGSDMLAVPWFGLQELRRLGTFAAALRPSGIRQRDIRHVRWIAMPQLGISSTMIRARIARGQSILYMVPEPVAHAIARRRLYQ